MPRSTKPKPLPHDETTGAGRGGPRPGSGRPPKPEALRRNQQITVALTPTQHVYVAQVATANGVSPSEAVRIIVDESMDRFRTLTQPADHVSRYGAPVAPEAMARRLIAVLEKDIGLHLDPHMATRLAAAISDPTGAALTPGA